MDLAGDLSLINWMLSHEIARLPAADTLNNWKKLFDNDSSEWDNTADRAAFGGFIAGKLAFAFAAGYESALHRLDPGIPKEGISCLCVTEEGGGHPKAIKTNFELLFYPHQA